MDDQRDAQTDWRVEASGAARASLNPADCQTAIWRHWTLLVEGQVPTPPDEDPNYPRTVCRDRHGREFWVVSSLSSRRTYVVLPEEL